MEHLVIRRMIKQEPQDSAYHVDDDPQIVAPAPSLLCVELKAPGYNWSED